MPPLCTGSGDVPIRTVSLSRFYEMEGQLRSAGLIQEGSVMVIVCPTFLDLTTLGIQ